MQHKTVVITGANSGIGFVTARELARQGAQVALVCRNPEKGAAAQDAIRRASGNNNIHLLQADLSSQASIRQLAHNLRQQFDRLDVLVNNAGAVFYRRQTSVDGIELTFALNHLGYFMLTWLLLDLLRASAPARVVNVSSEAHRYARLDMQDLQYTRRRYRGFRAYSQSKLANLLFTAELARQLEGSGVTANALHPGFVSTGFGANNGLLSQFFMWAVAPFALTPEQGAQTSIYLAASAAVEGVSGRYFIKSAPAAPAAAANDIALQQQLWAQSLALTQLG